MGQYADGATSVPHRAFGGSGESYAHEGEEFLYILRGKLEISLADGERIGSKEGDSFYFESSK